MRKKNNYTQSTTVFFSKEKFSIYREEIFENLGIPGEVVLFFLNFIRDILYHLREFKPNFLSNEWKGPRCQSSLCFLSGH